MPAPPPFVAHALELLAPLGAVQARRMFGGHGLYVDSLFIALITSERLYLKADAQSRAAFERAGCTPFAYSRSDQSAVTLGYWSAPDEAFQAAHFGKVILRDEPLARYCLWRQALTGQEAVEWDEFLEKLWPGETLRERLGQFRFSSDAPPTPANESPPSLADAARQLILAGLDPETR